LQQDDLRKKNDSIKNRDTKIIETAQELLVANSRNTKWEGLHLLWEKSPLPDVVEILLDFLELENDPVLREAAIIVLNNYEDERTEKFLAKAFFSKQEKNNVRSRIIWFFAQRKSELAYKIIMKGLSSHNEEIIYWVVCGFLQYDKESTPIKLLNKLLVNSQNSQIRQKIAWLYGKKCFKETTSVLCKILLAEDNANVRISCAWALGKIKNGIAIRPLCIALAQEDNYLVRREIALALGSLLRYITSYEQNAERKHFLQERIIKSCKEALLNDYYYFIRRVCATIFGSIQTEESLLILIQAYEKERNKFVRQAIIHSLGELGNKKALSLLQRAKRSTYSEIAFAAREAIKKISYENE
jgi:HEAT repeat protein